MTMRFTFSEPTEAIKQLKEGEQVNFSFVQQGNLSLLQDIKAL
ncbi:Cation efflux system protein CusF precursor [Kluyvera cryocrescens]|nr:Cation efflux system protein CusF precursor [Kluyvera cryocrescens]